MRRLYIAIILCVLFCRIIAASQNKSYLELYGAYDQITMSDYNQSQDETKTIYTYYGIKTDITRMDSAQLYEINYVYNLESMNAGTMGVYFRGGLLSAGNNAKIYYPTGEVFETISADYSVLYAGFGLRKYIASFFVGVDACGYFNGNNGEKDIIYYTDGAKYAEVDKTWPTSIYGLNFETGIDMWMNDSFGFSFRGGYRLAKGKIEINWGPDYDNQITEQNVDYSGYFIGGGILIGLGDGSKPEKGVNTNTNW